MGSQGTQLMGRLAVVTGAASGIGKAISHLFAKEGCTVMLLDRSTERVLQEAEDLKKQYSDRQHVGFSVDVSSSTSVKTAMDKILEISKTPPSILVNAAGITDDKSFLKMTEEQFDRVIAINLKGTYLVSQMMASMVRDHSVPDGSIINISSIVGKVGNIGQANYSASKAGVIGLTKTCAREVARYGIRCNAVLPGFINTPMTDKVPEPIMDQVTAFIPLQRVGTPEDVAEVCLFLASKRSQYITGAAIEVTGVSPSSCFGVVNAVGEWGKDFLQYLKNALKS